jgi:hypothetical protein
MQFKVGGPIGDEGYRVREAPVGFNVTQLAPVTRLGVL